MAPQFSTLSVQEVHRRRHRIAAVGRAFDAVESYFAHPLLVAAFAERVAAANPRPDELIIFTAHALPQRVIDAGDRYAEEVAGTARAVAERSGVTSYRVAFQSAGRTPEPWIGPEIGGVIDEESARGLRKFLVVPIGFACDHTEILFDIDVQVAQTAREFATSLRRTESLNASPTFISSLLEDLCPLAAMIVEGGARRLQPGRRSRTEREGFSRAIEHHVL